MGGTDKQHIRTYEIFLSIYENNVINERSLSGRFLQISNFEYLMRLNTLAGRSYNDITQVNLVFFSVFCELVNVVSSLIKYLILCSILFSRGLFLTTVQKVWTFQIHLPSEIFPR